MDDYDVLNLLEKYLEAQEQIIDDKSRGCNYVAMSTLFEAIDRREAIINRMNQEKWHDERKKLPTT